MGCGLRFGPWDGFACGSLDWVFFGSIGFVLGFLGFVLWDMGMLSASVQRLASRSQVALGFCIGSKDPRD